MWGKITLSNADFIYLEYTNVGESLDVSPEKKKTANGFELGCRFGILRIFDF